MHTKCFFFFIAQGDVCPTYLNFALLLPFSSNKILPSWVHTFQKLCSSRALFICPVCNILIFFCLSKLYDYHYTERILQLLAFSFLDSVFQTYDFYQCLFLEISSFNFYCNMLQTTSSETSSFEFVKFFWHTFNGLCQISKLFVAFNL